MIPGLDPKDTSRPPLARLNSGGLPVFAGQVHKVWRGQVQVPGCTEPSVPVALKWMSGQVKLSIELACSIAGSELHVRIPHGVVVLAERDQLPGLPSTARPLGNGKDFLCFGSLHQWPDDSATRMMDDEAAEEYVWQQLCRQPAAANGAVWDELAANPDRHVRNFIFDGKDYWFIDHEAALEPISKVMKQWAVQAARQSVIDFRAKKNLLALQLQQRKPKDHGMEQHSNALVRAQRRLEVVADRIREWRTGSSHVDVLWPLVEVTVRGIALRLPALPLMVHERLQTPEKKLIWNSSSSQR